MNKTSKKIISILASTLIILYVFTSYQMTFASSISTEKLSELLNQERSARNLNTLDWDMKLETACNHKAEHMIENNYFEHYAPNGTSPWRFIDDANYVYKLAGENLAMDFTTSKSVHDAWMASPTHKDNMLNPDYEDFAICTIDGKIDGEDTTLVVEIFGKKDNIILAKTNRLVASILNYLLGKNQNIK
jgi:uncharacterized protein YkwD